MVSVGVNLDSHDVHVRAHQQSSFDMSLCVDVKVLVVFTQFQRAVGHIQSEEKIFYESCCYYIDRKPIFVTLVIFSQKRDPEECSEQDGDLTSISC